MDSPDITQPLRLAVGSQARDSGFACGMNIIAWETQVEITDYPDCAASPLSIMVQTVNDNYCAHIKTVYVPYSAPLDLSAYGVPSNPAEADVCTVHLLCSKCSIPVLELAHRTVGTAGIKSGYLRWASECLRELTAIVNVYTAETLRDIAALRSAPSRPEQDRLFAALGASSPRADRPKAESSAQRAGMDYVRALTAMESWRAIGEFAIDRFAARYARTWIDHAMAVGDREQMMIGTHRAFDAWEKVTGRKAPEPEPEQVAQVIARATAGAR
jgi:hypothetical protein